MEEDKELEELTEEVGGYLKRHISRRQAIKLGGLGARLADAVPRPRIAPLGR